MYAFVQNNAVAKTTIRLPQAWTYADGKSTGNFDLLPQAAQVAEGWYPLIEIVPPFNPDLQRISGFSDTIFPDRVERTHTIELIPVTELKQTKIAQLDALLVEKFSGSTLLFDPGTGPVAFTFNELLASNATQLQASLALPGATFPTPFSWTLADGTELPMDLATFQDFAAAVASYKLGLYATYKVHAAAITAATDPNDVAAYDITAEWPG